jgi:hypothetical protein
MSRPYFCALSDDEPALTHSPIIRGLERTFAYIADKGLIGLTPSGAFKRVFVEWAAEAFDWPGHRPQDLYAVNKVLNEPDFFPLMELHEIMLALKLGRHVKGTFKLTPLGRTFVGRPGRLFGLLAPFYLFRVDHGRHARLRDERLLGNWDVFLNVINVEAQSGVSGARLREALYGPPASGQSFDPIMGSLFIEVLRPLCWLGLLAAVGEERRSWDSLYVKTPLWFAALRLDTDAGLKPIVTH